MKPRRDITLGEMQDECRRRNAFCGDMGACPYRDFCRETVGDKCGWGDKDPRDWNLADPPRFTEAQMAFLRGCYGIGIVAIMRSGDRAKMHLFTKFETIGVIKNAEIPLEIGETLDLAELLGKDGAE